MKISFMIKVYYFASKNTFLFSVLFVILCMGTVLLIKLLEKNCNFIDAVFHFIEEVKLKALYLSAPCIHHQSIDHCLQ